MHKSNYLNSHFVVKADHPQLWGYWHAKKQNTMPTKINSLDELKALASDEAGADIFLLLGGGIARSSKHIWYDEQQKTWMVYNEIDDSEQDNMSDETLGKATNIITAIENGVLYLY